MLDRIEELEQEVRCLKDIVEHLQEQIQIMRWAQHESSEGIEGDTI